MQWASLCLQEPYKGRWRAAVCPSNKYTPAHGSVSVSLTHTQTLQMQSEDKEDESGRWSGERQVTFRAHSEHVKTRHKDTCQPCLWQQLLYVCVWERECECRAWCNRFVTLYVTLFNSDSWSSGQIANTKLRCIFKTFKSTVQIFKVQKPVLWCTLTVLHYN